MAEGEGEFIEEEVTKEVGRIHFKELARLLEIGLVLRQYLHHKLNLNLHNHVLIDNLIVLETSWDDLLV